ncbi:hypothetical protein ACJ41O_004379 [Fusarium nematophilum]
MTSKSERLLFLFFFFFPLHITFRRPPSRGGFKGHPPSVYLISHHGLLKSFLPRSLSTYLCLEETDVEMAASTDEAPQLIIGIDFGTTHELPSYPDYYRIKHITHWKSTRDYNSDKEKVPSAISYSDSPPEWGYAVPLDESVLRWFKLLIVDEGDLPGKIQGSPQIFSVRRLVKRANKTPAEVIGEYLRGLWKHSRESIIRSVGQRMFKVSRLHFVVTLPAIWPHYTRARMEEALKHAVILNSEHAGQTSHSFISEPEAAALSCLEENSDRTDVKVGDHFVVCDAGGGTVDIITYTVVKLHPLTVRESVRGDGDLCGAMFLDENFRTLLKKLIPADIQSQIGESGLLKIMSDDWEHGIKPNNLVSDQIKQVKAQHRRVPKFVILVGGFGKSKFLYECLQETVGDRIEVLQDDGDGPWTAVIRGAVLHGLAEKGLTDSIAVQVDSRISRYNYGTLFNILPFEEDEHHHKDRQYCPVNQDFLAVDQTKWFVEIGEAVSARVPIRCHFWQELSNPNDEILVEIVFSDALHPPRRKDRTVKSLGVIRISKVPDWDKLYRWTNTDGEEFRQFTYELRMVSDGASLDFSVYYNKERLGSQSVCFESSNQPDGTKEPSKAATKQMASGSGSGSGSGDDAESEGLYLD